MTEFETITYEERNKVAWVTLNRPEKYNAFNEQMQRDLRTVWRSLRSNDDVNAVVLTATGDKAFCTGIDREQEFSALDDSDTLYGTSNNFMYDDPGDDLGPKSCDLWKPVIVAVNGIACGGAFYMLSEADIIISSDNATFFDPHVTYGLAAVYEPMKMLNKMPFGEIMRLSLLGNYERMTAETAHRIGLVSEVVPLAELQAAATWLAESIATQPAIAVQATMRAIWAANDLSREQAKSMAPALMTTGMSTQAMAEGRAAFESGVRITPRLR
jgi:enoyl-CoA hydratase/carnithine racemase